MKHIMQKQPGRWGGIGRNCQLVFSESIIGKQLSITITNYCNSNPKYESQFGTLVKASGQKPGQFLVLSQAKASWRILDQSVSVKPQKRGNGKSLLGKPCLKNCRDQSRQSLKIRIIEWKEKLIIPNIYVRCHVIEFRFILNALYILSLKITTI